MTAPEDMTVEEHEFWVEEHEFWKEKYDKWKEEALSPDDTDPPRTKYCTSCRLLTSWEELDDDGLCAECRDLES